MRIMTARVQPSEVHCISRLAFIAAGTYQTRLVACRSSAKKEEEEKRGDFHDGTVTRVEKGLLKQAKVDF